MADPPVRNPNTLPLVAPAAPAPPVVGLLPGRILAGRYRVDALIGQGGMGAVYEVEHLLTGQRLALKTLLPDVPRVAEVIARFRREGMAGSLLEHPNLVEVYDLGALDDGGLFLAMELVRGASLRVALDPGPLPARRALVIARQILEGLDHAHARGIVHRDLKPENVMLVRQGEVGAEYEVVKLLDFGLVKLIGDAALDLGGEKLTRTGVVFGTPAYMAPEHALGRPVDGRADLYALGVILFEALIGRPPFAAADPMQLMRLQITAFAPALAEAAPGRPWCTPAMEHLVRRALAKPPEERFATAAQMLAALDAAFASLDHLPAGT